MKPSKLRPSQIKRASAMPHVRTLVNKWGLTTVQSCLNQMRELERELRELKETEMRVTAIKRRLASPR